MLEEFELYLRAHTHLDDGDIDRVISLAVPRTLRRNEFLLREGEICRHKTFIVKGLLRTFGTAADGSEHILQFSPELHWTLDAESYDHQRPAQFNISAIENSEVMGWAKPDFDGLLASIPELKSWAERLISSNIYLS